MSMSVLTNHPRDVHAMLAVAFQLQALAIALSVEQSLPLALAAVVLVDQLYQVAQQLIQRDCEAATQGPRFATETFEAIPVAFVD